MLRRNFVTAMFGSLAAMFTGRAAKAGSAGTDWREMMLAAERARLGRPFKSFADLGPDAKFRMEIPASFDWNGEKCDMTLRVPSPANVHHKVIADGDCLFVGTYIAPHGKTVEPAKRAAMLCADASPAMNVVVLDVNGTLVKISTLGIADRHDFGVNVVNGPSDAVKIVSCSNEPYTPRRVKYRDLDGVVHG